MRLTTTAWRRACAIGAAALLLVACAGTGTREIPDRAFTMAVPVS